MESLVKWTKDTVAMGAQSFPAKESYPVIYRIRSIRRNTSLNTGLTIEDRATMAITARRLGRHAIVKAKGRRGSDIRSPFAHENWKLP
jgi:hypothetical protein